MSPKRSREHGGLGLRHLAGCVDSTIRLCKMSETIFTGCPEVAQLVARVLTLLDYDFDVVVGKVETFDQQVIGHVWIELPDEELRVETNPSQVYGLPTMAIAAGLDTNAWKYREGERGGMELLQPVTEAGEKFYTRLAKQVIACMWR